MNFKRTARLALIGMAALVLFSLAGDSTALAQCAMCRAVVSGASNSAALTKSFNTAVLVLLAPPVSIFCSIFIVAYRHRKPRADQSPEEAESDQ